MARTAAGGLSKHPTKGFRVTVGKTNDGRYRTFWLGHNRAIAEHHADLLKAGWQRVKDEGGEVWSDRILENIAFWVGHFKRSIEKAKAQRQAGLEYIEQMRREMDEEAAEDAAIYGDAVGAEEATQPEESPADAGPTLYGAITAFVTHLKGKRTSDKHKHRAKQVLEVNLKHVRQDCPLSDIDFVWIDSLCDHFKGRPANQKDGQPLSPTTVKNILTYLRLFFVWLDDTSYGKWEAPRKLLKPFKVRIDDLKTPKELREIKQIDQFDMATLVKLYKAGSDHQRSIMLMALFTGATQQELAVMEKSEFDFDAGTLTHHRNKTGVKGVYWLPPELVTLLKADFAKRPNDPLAYRTAEGNALVTFIDGRQTSDAVRQSWDDLRDAAEIPDALSFKYLRKYLADWMTEHAGEEMGQTALSHAPQTVLGRNYTDARPYARFNKLQKQMHREFTAAGMFQVRVTKEQKKKAA